LKNKIALFALLFSCAALLAADVAPLITIVAPPSGSDPLLIGQTVHIRWTHSAYYDAHAQTCQIFCGEQRISPDLAVTADDFAWTIGRRHDGTTMAPGDYEITIESLDYDALNGPQIRIAFPALPGFKLLNNRIRVDKIPDCPMCYRLDPGQIKFDAGGPVVVDVELLRNGVVLARLGRFGPRLGAPGPVKIILKRESGGQMRRQSSYELRFLSAKGEVLHREAIRFAMAR